MLLFLSTGKTFSCVSQVRQVYERDKRNPPVNRNLPPVTGKIMWARQLLKRIESPLEMMQKTTKILEVTHFQLVDN